MGKMSGILHITPLLFLPPSSSPSLTYFPLSIGDTTTFIGVATYCFGLSSLAFPIEESMEHKENFSIAVLYSLIFVWFVYVLIGNGAAILYIHDSDGINDNILMNLPEDSVVASLVRFAMASVSRSPYLCTFLLIFFPSSQVCLLTYPLTLIAPAQMIEYFIGQYLVNRHQGYQRIYDGEPEVPEATSQMKIITRMSLIAFCTFSATFIPCFGAVSLCLFL